MADFDSPGGGVLPGTATHVHFCRSCRMNIPCAQSCPSARNMPDVHASGVAWNKCCGCESADLGLGRCFARHDLESATGMVIVYFQPKPGVEVQIRKDSLANAFWFAHESAKELLRQAGIDPAKGRW